MNYLTHLECSLCKRNFEPGRRSALCPCGGPLLARYNLERVRLEWTRAQVSAARPDMWRYAPLLPVPGENSIISLGEGLTPLRRARGVEGTDVWIKDEGLNPTGSFKARGLACAVSMARELGLADLAMGSAGNAASALAAYAAGGHPGRGPDRGLCPAGGGEKRGRRVVRYGHPEGTLPGGRQEDYGL
jgi:threonine synthase